MDVNIILQSMGYILNAAKRVPVNDDKGQVDAFQRVFIEELFAKQFVSGGKLVMDNSSEDPMTKNSSVIVEQLITRLFTDKLVKSDALGIRQLILGDKEDDT